MKYWMDFAALALLYVLVLARRWRAQGRDRLAVNTLLYLYLAAVAFVTLMPVLPALPFVWNHPYQPMNPVPFLDVTLRRGDFLRQVGLNVLLTVPFGVLFPLTRTGAGRFGRTAACCFLMSLGIELLQPLLSGTRTSDVTDLITNTLGGMLGYGGYLLIRPLAGRVLDRLARSCRPGSLPTGGFR